MKELTVIEHKNQRVLMSEQLAKSYNVTSKMINNNYLNNSNRYILGKHFYCLEGDDLRGFKRKYENLGIANNINKLYLWTEKGAWLHAKSLGSDEAWEAYELLVDDYYKIKDVNQLTNDPQKLIALALVEAQKLLESKDKVIEEMRPKAEFFDAVADSKDAIDIGSAAKVLNMGIGRNTLFEILRDNNILMQNNQPYQRYVDMGYFRTIEQKFTKPDGSTCISIKTLVYQKGLDFIRRILHKESA